MYVIEYLTSIPDRNNILTEEQNPNIYADPTSALIGQVPQQNKRTIINNNYQVPNRQINNDDDNDNDDINDDGTSIEFENIKKYLLYGKVKNLKSTLELSEYNNKNNNITKLKEFLDLILLFFNTFTYEQLTILVDDVITTLDSYVKTNKSNKLIGEKLKYG